MYSKEFHELEKFTNKKFDKYKVDKPMEVR